MSWLDNNRWVSEKSSVCLLPHQSRDDWLSCFTLGEKQLRQQALAIKTLFRTRSQSPSPAFDQLIKGFQISIQNAILLEKEASDLRAENEKKIQAIEERHAQIDLFLSVFKIMVF